MSLNRCILDYFREDRYSGTDIVKMIVIVSFSAISFMLTSVAPDYGAYPISPLFYCIPILLVALWFPRQGFRVTALLVAGFVLIRVYLSALGFIIDPVMTGLHTMIFFWVFGTTILFSQESRLTASRCRQIVQDTRNAKFLCDPETLRPVCVSRRCADMLGYTPQELVGIPAELFWADEGGKVRFIEEMKRDFRRLWPRVVTRYWVISCARFWDQFSIKHSVDRNQHRMSLNFEGQRVHLELTFDPKVLTFRRVEGDAA